MALNILKLCVGCDSVEELEAWVAHRLEERRRNGEPVEHWHTTRMVPTRADEIIGAGSLYWVIKGNVQCRQLITDIRPYIDPEGIRRCRIVLDAEIIHTQWQPRRPFQGWRYLKPEDAPADLGVGATGIAEMSPELRQELAELGLL
ncbi:DUF1489 family protein [Aquamicrobium segne]|uniref:DUF1489 family protein n=1 Tax=Aquamicrobium segne TaxID=469547 RepID=A0ABW0GV92_9HYPH